MAQCRHEINRDKFFAEMEKRGWKMEHSCWMIPTGRRRHDREVDWYESIISAIECPCEKEKEASGDATKGPGDTRGV